MIEQQSKTIQFGKITFSEFEIQEIIKAWLAISFAFAMLLAGGFGSNVFTAFIISSLTVGIGFIAHELGHKILAQKYGAWAEFRAWNQGLILAVIMSFFGFILAAPGAVLIHGRTIGISRYGKIAAAGPIMSYAAAFVFFIVMKLFPAGILNIIGSYGFTINTWLGLFNMIPFAMLDGKKIWDWNRGWYFGLVGIGVILMLINNI